MKKLFPAILLTVVVIIFFWKFLFQGLLPIPADTIVGLYNPYRDYYSKDYERGVPFKNFLITDPVRQQYPWKNLTIELEKKFHLPLWNPYNFSGTPHLANLQSGVFYPFNITYLIFPFSFSWSLLVLLQPLLASLFLFYFLINLKISKIGSLLGSITFAFCGFAIAWLEWGNILHTALWLPLMLLSVDKIIKDSKKFSMWWLVLTLASVFSFFAGHIQIFLYAFVVFALYFIFRWVENGKIFRFILFFIIYILSFIILTFPQWFPTLQFIGSSARAIDQLNWMISGWFVPWQNIVQFMAPDFFGNPATLNYFGEFNYGEFVGYIGILPLIMALYSVFKKDKTTMFFWLVLSTAIVFAFPNLISELPYRLSIPFISTSQPTRLIFIIDFCLSVLAAIGADHFIKSKEKKKVVFIITFLFLSFLALWVFVSTFGIQFTTSENLAVAKRNLILPSILFVIISSILIIYAFAKKLQLNKKVFQSILLVLFIILLLDLFRFGWKYTTFAESKYLYPSTKTISYLRNNLGNFRVMSTDSKILPANFTIMYKIQSVDGYDPLYLQNYAELMAAMGRNQPNIDPPFGFNRILAPQNYKSHLIDLLGVKYIISMDEIKEPRFTKVFEEGKTKVYQNAGVFDRAFFIEKTVYARDKKEAIQLLFEEFPLNKKAVVQNVNSNFSKDWSVGKANIENYNETQVVISTQNEAEGFLVLTDSFYPTWKAEVDGKLTQIYLTDYNFRGIIVPAGKHTVTFKNSLF